jgi:hypothetical protein
MSFHDLPHLCEFPSKGSSAVSDPGPPSSKREKEASRQPAIDERRSVLNPNSIRSSVNSDSGARYIGGDIVSNMGGHDDVWMRRVRARPRALP